MGLEVITDKGVAEVYLNYPPVNAPDSSGWMEIAETITHLAFYAGWPSAVTAVTVAKDVFGKKPEKP